MLKNLTFFHSDFGKEFLLELCGEVHPETAPLQALRCALCSTEQSTFQGEEKGENVPRKRRKRGGLQRGKKDKRTRENRSEIAADIGVSFELLR